jgi:Fe-S-cluster containining protein
MSRRAAAAPLCNRCAALCCRLQVVLLASDVVPDALTVRAESGERRMARGADGWCVAVSAERRCSIYETRPQACRNFTMAGPYCRAVRADAARDARLAANPAPLPVELR